MEFLPIKLFFFSFTRLEYFKGQKTLLFKLVVMTCTCKFLNNTINFLLWDSSSLQFWPQSRKPYRVLKGFHITYSYSTKFCDQSVQLLLPIQLGDVTER